MTPSKELTIPSPENASVDLTVFFSHFAGRRLGDGSQVQKVFLNN